jgi:putative FmdB family regulatory protein
MPLYDYRCKSCGAVKEVLQAHDAPAPACDTLWPCAVMEREVSSAAFTLKGTGWYKPGHSS